MGKVIYGLKNVHYAEYDEATGEYGSLKAIPGAVSLSADADTTQNDFYADNIIYATISASSKETGTIEFAAITPEMYVDLFGYREDAATGILYQPTEPVTKTFALAYEVSGNAGRTRGVRYNVTFTAPSQSANTMTDSTNPDTVSVNYTAVGRDFVVGGNTVNVLKSHIEEGGTAFDSFFTSVITPGESASSANLTAITITNIDGLTPTFASSVTDYSATASSATSTISVTKADSDATTAIAVNGIAYSSSASWTTGNNVVTILVTNGTAVKLYTVIVAYSA